MKTKLLSDVELRAAWSKTRTQTYSVEPGTILTPAARDFLREHNIELRFETAYVPMPRTPVPMQEGRPQYVKQATGERLSEKPEEMTHLYGNVLVPKTDRRIAFRGRLDSLNAAILEVQVTADEKGESGVLRDLEEIRVAVLNLMRAEVLEEPVPELRLLGFDSRGLRHASHDVQEVFGMEHTMPDCRMGRIPVALNRLRTQVREAELSAADAFFENGVCRRTDIVECLNRLSSAVYIIYCRKLSGFYDRRS